MQHRLRLVALVALLALPKELMTVEMPSSQEATWNAVEARLAYTGFDQYYKKGEHHRLKYWEMLMHNPHGWQVFCLGSPEVAGVETFDCGDRSFPRETCRGTCNEGLYGFPKVTCKANGQWGPILNSCTDEFVLRVGGPNSNLCVQVNGNNIDGAALILRPCTGKEGPPNNQLFRFVRAANGRFFQTTTGDFNFDVFAGSTATGTDVSLFTIVDVSPNNQKWNQNAGGGWVPVHTNTNPRCLSTENNTVTEGINLAIQACNSSSAAQIFIPTGWPFR